MDFNDIETEADKKKMRKGTGPALSPRDTGPAGMMTVGKAGPGGGKPPMGQSVTPKDTKRGKTSYGTSGNTANRDKQTNSPTTTQKKTGTVKKK